jgi:uncharacterized repeat protein (TIGR02543 family)
MDTSTYTTDGPDLTLSENGFVKDHYYFGGWSLDQCEPNVECAVLDTITVTQDTIVYATWISQQYTINYDTTTATSGSVDSDTYTWGDAPLSLPTSPFGDPTVTKLHYTFGGWYFGTDTLTVYTELSDADAIIQALTENGDSITLHALWNLAIYHITYNVNGATSGSYTPDTYTSGDSATVLNNGSAIHKTGFNFAGWMTTVNNGLTGITSYGSEHDVTVYALWTPVVQANTSGSNTVTLPQTVTFNGNGSTGGSMAPQNGISAAALTSNGFTRTGFTFSGWNTLATGGGTAYANGATYSFLTSVTLYAQWTEVVTPNVTTYTVTYNSQGGSAASGGSTTYVAGGSITLPGASSQAGFTFNGWFIAATGGTALGATYSPSGTGNITIYAQWTAIQVTIYTVTFNGNGSTGGSMAAQSGSSAAALTSNAFTRTGFTFSGWNTVAAGGGTAFANGATYGFSASVTLYAQWSAVNYSVTYDSQGGSAASGGSTTYVAGGSITFPGAPTRAGYTFDGWFEAATGGSGLGASFSPSGTGDITFYAQWTGKKATVKYNSRGGSTVDPDVTTVGSDITLADGPTRGGYSFLGWFEAPTGGTALDSPYTVTENVTLYAHWQNPKLVGFVLFGNDVRTVGPLYTNSALNAIAAKIVAGEFTNVSLTGYFSQVGTLAHNRLLASDRAANAKAYLVKRLAKLGYDGVTNWTVNSSLVANFGSDANNRRVQVYGS